MSRKKLTYIIILMSLALLGMVGLQFYWIKNAISINEERFKQGVHDVLNAVVKRLEHREILYVTQENIDRSRSEQSKFVMKFDSTGTARWQENKVITKKHILSNDALASDGFEIEVQEEAIISKTGFARRSKPGPNVMVFDVMQDQLNPMMDSVDNAKHRQNYLRMVNKSEMVAIVLENLVNFDKPIEKRLDRALLDSLLRVEVCNKGINIAYDFGVLDTQKRRLVFTSECSNKLDLLQSGFNIRLFPNDEFAPPSYLYLNFPDKQQYIFRDTALVFASSVALIMVISFCFAIAIFTIIRQKKLSEITNDFINNMTHEFKTPIATVSLACEAMQDPDMRSNERQLIRYLQIIKDENDRLGRQVEKVLQIATLERSDFKLKITEVDVHDIILKAMQNIAIQIESRGGDITTDLQAGNSFVEADEVHLTNIIYNLLDNANKYSPEAPEIRICTEEMKKGIVITISDKGQGIAKETINRVFDKFYRVPTGNIHNVKGFGLGLSYVKTMVDAHHGGISVKSELHKGSTFTIFLPYKHEQH